MKCLGAVCCRSAIRRIDRACGTDDGRDDLAGSFAPHAKKKTIPERLTALAQGGVELACFIVFDVRRNQFECGRSLPMGIDIGNEGSTVSPAVEFGEIMRE